MKEKWFSKELFKYCVVNFLSYCDNCTLSQFILSMSAHRRDFYLSFLLMRCKCLIHIRNFLKTVAAQKSTHTLNSSHHKMGWFGLERVL